MNARKATIAIADMSGVGPRLTAAVDGLKTWDLLYLRRTQFTCTDPHRHEMHMAIRFASGIPSALEVGFSIVSKGHSCVLARSR